MNNGSVANRIAASPELTDFCAQCSVPCPTRKNVAPMTIPAIQFARTGRNPRVAPTRAGACLQQRDEGRP